MKDYIRVSDVEKYYGNGTNVTKAVDRVSFHVEQGEFIGVMGGVRLRQNDTSKYAFYN